MIYIFVWLIGSALAFEALRRLALRDFGSVTVAGLIGLVLFSLLTPPALITAFILWLMNYQPGGALGKVVWKRR